MEEAFEAPDTIRRMLITTWGLLYSLKPEQRRQCEFAMTDPGRLDWDFIPKPDRQGIPLAQLDSHQRTLVHALNYRVQGAQILIEFDNAIDSGNHIHSVWRDYRNDLGHDLLAAHYERERATGHHLATRLRSSVPDD